MAKGKYEKWLEADNRTLLGAWARDGLTQAQMAKNMGISLSTFKEWIKKYPAISAAIKKGKELADYEMENALYKKGIGYTVTLKKPFKVKKTEYENGKKIRETEEIEYAEVEEYIPPDTTAQIFWLKNRKPDEWRDKREAPPVEEKYEDDGFIDALKKTASQVFNGVDAQVEVLSDREREAADEANQTADV